jgi:putative acetyltransferase
VCFDFEPAGHALGAGAAMLIRTARESDTAMIAAIHRESREATMPWLPRLHTPEEDLFFFESSVMKTCEVFVSQVDAHVTGFCAVRGDWIDHLYIRPGMLRQGFGTRLLDQAKLGRPALQLWTFQKNENARRFYEVRGFTPAEQTDGHANEEREPDVRYVWRANAA